MQVAFKVEMTSLKPSRFDPDRLVVSVNLSEPFANTLGALLKCRAEGKFEQPVLMTIPATDYVMEVHRFGVPEYRHLFFFIHPETDELSVSGYFGWTKAGSLLFTSDNFLVEM